MPDPVHLPLPEKLVAKAREFSSGERTPVHPRDAATVILLRESAPDRPPSVVEPVETPPSGSDVYLLRRQTSMDFAGGMCVFPGGGVDRRDFEESVAWAGPTPAQWATRLACAEPLARALVCAAVRETFEESGVLLAGTSAHEVVADTTGPDWEADRAALESRELSMTDFLNRRGLMLRTDLLGAYAAWTTPEFEPKRFATWFFVAALPPGQRTRDVSRESDQVMWLPAAEVVAQVDQGTVFMMPPTYLTCLDVAQHGSPAAMVADSQERTLEMFTPEVVMEGQEYRLSVPNYFREMLA